MTLVRSRLIGAIVAALVAVGVASAASPGWSIGDNDARVYADPGTSDLNLKATADVNSDGRHIRLIGRDGNFEFEIGTAPHG
jgi:hypothetical protein